LVQDLRSDDPAVRNTAAQRIWVRYFPDLLELARQSLNRRIRSAASTTSRAGMPSGSYW
jgi:hypothetical protein